MEGLWEDVSCSICLDTLDNPVSIKCGHNFCHQCLSKYWDEVLAEGEVTQCPECRQPCARDHVMPDTRLRRMVEKIIEMEQVRPQASLPSQQPCSGPLQSHCLVQGLA